MCCVISNTMALLQFAWSMQANFYIGGDMPRGAETSLAHVQKWDGSGGRIQRSCWGWNYICSKHVCVHCCSKLKFIAKVRNTNHQNNCKTGCEAAALSTASVSTLLHSSRASNAQGLEVLCGNDYHSSFFRIFREEGTFPASVNFLTKH